MPVMEQQCDSCGVFTKAITLWSAKRQSAVDPRVPQGYFGRGGSRMINGRRMGPVYQSSGLCDSCSDKVKEFIRTITTPNTGG